MLISGRSSWPVKPRRVARGQFLSPVLPRSGLGKLRTSIEVENDGDSRAVTYGIASDQSFWRVKVDMKLSDTRWSQARLFIHHGFR